MRIELPARLAAEGVALRPRARNVERGRRVDVVWFGLLREECSWAPQR